MIRLIGGAFYKEAQTRKKLAKFVQHTKRFSFDTECKTFELAFAKWQGRKDAIFVNSGSSANLALIQALLNLGRLKKGDKVAFSAVTWSTNVMPLIKLGLIPIPMDVEQETLNTSSKEVERVIKKEKVKAVFITNLLGFSHDLREIKKLCKKHNVLLLEDNCESLGSVERGTKLGNFGLASTFSFYVGHHMSTIEGGMIATNDPELSDALRVVRAHGWDRHLSPKSQKRLRKTHGVESFYGLYAFYDLGYNFRPHEINGYLGNLQLPYANEMVSRREQIFKTLAKVLEANPDRYQPLRYDHMTVCSAFALPIVCASLEIKQEVLKRAEGKAESRPIVGGNMVRQPFFKKYHADHKRHALPVADRIHTHGLYLPIHPEMTRRDVQTIISILQP